MKIRQGLRRGDKPQLDKFEIKGYKNIWIDLTGLGTIDFLIELIVNMATNAFKGTITHAMSGPIHKALQKELDELPINFFDLPQLRK